MVLYPGLGNYARMWPEYSTCLISNSTKYYLNVKLVCPTSAEDMQRSMRGITMDGIDKSQILKSEQFQQLLRRQARYAWSFALTSFLGLVIFIGLAVWVPDLYARQLFSSGFFTVGMAAGIFIFIICISLTGIYLHRCNVEFEPLQKKMLEQCDESQ